MNLEHIYNLCTELQQISSTKEKEKFLIDNRCKDFDEFLKWLLDPQIITGIDKKKLKKKTNVNYVGEYITFESILNHLKENNTGRDFDIAMCQLFIAGNLKYKNFLTDVFTKSLKIGVNLKTVNKVYGKNFIHVHEVQLGSPRDKLRLKDGEWFSLSQKMNGIRCTYVEGKMISRQGKEFKGLDHIVDCLKSLDKSFTDINSNNQIVIDGELIRKNNDGVSDNENFRLTTSIVNSEFGDKSELEFVIFDALYLEDFYCGKSRDNYKFRRYMVDNIANYAKKRKANIRAVEIVYQGTDQTEIDNQLAIADVKGWEGLMLNKNAPYECKRTTNLIKIKSFKFSDLKIVDYVEGEGKYRNMLGAIIVDYKGNKVNVGSGFNEEDRIKYWKNPDNLIGKIVTVKYKEVSEDSKTGKESLQFPVFLGIREDKIEPSYE